MRTITAVIPALVLAASFFTPVANALAPAVPAAPAAAVPSADWRADAAAMSLKAQSWLRSQQDKATGAWSVQDGKPSFPAITGLVLTGLIEEENQNNRDPMADASIAAGVKYLLSMCKPDGGIYDKLLPSYNTAICATALAHLNTPEAKAATAKAIEFLKSIQYGEGAMVYEDNPDAGQKVDKAHPYYGGWGYGNHGRPDLSNTAFVIEALHAAGVPESDPSYQRALVFLSRLQMDGTVNDMDYAKGSKQGGFVYAAGSSQDTAGTGQAYSANPIEETLDNGEKVSRMRAYGSVTYSGFKSLIYAGLKREDPRVQSAYRWICENYSVTENPGMGPVGMYYYYIAFARALDALGVEVVPTTSGGTKTESNWAQDLTAQLKTLQSDDGSFKSLGKRWMEDNQILITSYSVIALQAAGHKR